MCMHAQRANVHNTAALAEPTSSSCVSAFTTENLVAFAQEERLPLVGEVDMDTWPVQILIC